jgi:hypothetical protein
MVQVQYPAMVTGQTCDFVIAPSAAPGYVGCTAARFCYERSQRRSGHRRGNCSAHPRLGDPASVEEGVDLPVPERAHPGGRIRRGGPPSVSLPPAVAGGAQRGEVRPGTGDVGRASRHAPAHCGRPSPPGPRARPGARARPAPTRSRLLPLGQRAVHRGEQLVRHRHAAVRARDSAQGGRRVRLSGQERGAPHAAGRGSRGGPVRAGAAARQAQRRPILGVSQRFRVGRPATRTTSTRDSKNLSGTDTPSKTYAPGTARCWAPQPSSARIPR